MKALVLALALVLSAAVSHANETGAEKAEAQSNNGKRAMTKAGHAVKEATCMKGDAKCAAQKAGDTAKEGGAAAKDKIKEGANKVD